MTTTTPRSTAAAANDRSDAALDQIDPASIDIDAAFNPRTTMDDEQLRELTTSVRSVGVLQPLTVVRTDKGRYRLVAGHRRLAAARAAKLPTVPALVYDTIDDASRLQFAIIENLQREDMNAIDEASAYQRAITEGSLTQKQLASVIGKSASHISERLRLLKLPPKARAALAEGKLPLAAAKPLGVLAALKVPTAMQITEWVVSSVLEDEQFLDDLLDDPAHALYSLAGDDEAEGAPFLFRVNSYSRELPLAGHVDTAVIAKLAERRAALGVRHVTLDQSDIDAARAYGCLIELDSRFTPQRFVTDAEFLVSRVNEALDLLEQRKLQQQTQNPTSPDPESDSGTTSAGTGIRPAPSSAALAEDRNRERAQADKERIAAIHANRDLGLRLAKQLGSRKFDRPVAELLVQLVLAQNHDLAVAGIAYTHEDFHELVTKRQKNGKTRTTFTQLDKHDAHKRALEWVLRPRSAEEVLGRLLQLLVAGVFADERAVAKSKREHWYAPGSRTTEPMIAKLARKLLPEHFHIRADRLLPKPEPKTKKPTTKPSTPSTTKKSKVD
jgi:ParB/RepB/Spo0J family partition protein